MKEAALTVIVWQTFQKRNEASVDLARGRGV